MVLYEIVWSLLDNAHGAGSTLPIDLFPDSAKLFSCEFKETVEAASQVKEYLRHVESKDKSQTGMYEAAFSDGINAVLENFFDKLYQIELTILNDPDISILSIAGQLEPYLCTFRAINCAIEEKQKKSLYGVQLLDLCEKFTHFGSKPVEEAFRKILSCCLKAFLLQTTKWVLFGDLFDPYEEYFIVKQKQIFHYSNESVASTMTQMSMPDVERWVYSISLDRLPSLLPYSVASMILFAGESLLSFRRDSTDWEENRDDDILKMCGLDKGEIAREISLFEKREQFNFSEFFSLIANVWTSVNKYTRKLAEDVADVKKQLTQMRDVYCLGRGELFQEFLSRADKFLNADAVSIGSRRLQSAFESSLFSVYLTESSDLLSSISFSLPPKDQLYPGIKTWDVIQVNSKIKWPLGSLFTPEVMRNYNTLFKFLIRLKKAEMDLNFCWKTSNLIKKQSDLLAIIQVRNYLRALIGNLQYYCFTDVIANEMSSLMISVDKTDTFTDIQKALATFLGNVMDQLFLSRQKSSLEDPTQIEEPTMIDAQQTMSLHSTYRDDGGFDSCKSLLYERNRKIQSCFKTLFIICEKFPVLLDVIKESPSEINKVNILKQKMMEKIKILVKLSEVTSVQDCNYLNNLMVILDYNEYFRDKYCSLK